MDAGKLDQVIRRAEATQVPDGLGGVVETEAYGAAIPAQVMPENGREEIIGDQEIVKQRYRVTVRNMGRGAALSAGDRVQWGDLDLHIETAPCAGRAAWRHLTALVWEEG